MNVATVCTTLNTVATFSKEPKIHTVLKVLTRKKYWKYCRIETVNQIGMPDALLLRGDTYWLVEAKILKKKQLVSLENDLVWQFGQIAFMQKSLKNKLNYMLAVGKDNMLALIIGDYHARECSNYPDFIG